MSVPEKFDYLTVAQVAVFEAVICDALSADKALKCEEGSKRRATLIALIVAIGENADVDLRDFYWNDRHPTIVNLRKAYDALAKETFAGRTPYRKRLRKAFGIFMRKLANKIYKAKDKA